MNVERYFSGIFSRLLTLELPTMQFSAPLPHSRTTGLDPGPKISFSEDGDIFHLKILLCVAALGSYGADTLNPVKSMDPINFLWRAGASRLRCSKVDGPDAVCQFASFPQLGLQIGSVQHNVSGSRNSDQAVSNVTEDSATTWPISHLSCFQKHTLVHCLAVTWDFRWLKHDVEPSWSTAQLIARLSN